MARLALALCFLLLTVAAYGETLLLPCDGRPALALPDDVATTFEVRRARVLDRLATATELRANAARRKFAGLAGLESIEPIWLVHALRASGTAAALAVVQRQWTGGDVTRDTRTSRRAAFDEVPAAQTAARWNLRRIGAPALWQRDMRGAGIAVAVLDGGFDVTHPSLRRGMKNPEGWDFVTNATLGPDRDGHGTAAAGIVAGTDTGVAPEASLFVGRVCCDADDGLFETTVWRAVQTALRKNVRVISMSLSVKAFEEPNYALWRRAGAVVLAADALWIVSAGNRPDDPVGAPAANPPPWATGGGTAGDTRTATIAVGASDEQDRPRPLSSAGLIRWVDIAPYLDFENGLRKPELCAPSDVRAPAPGGGYREVFAGTSAATPHVAGVAALLWAARPQATALMIADALRQGAKAVGNRCGAGRVDAVRSLAASALSR